MKIRISRLDRKFSIYIRSRAGWQCERCQKTRDHVALQCSHFHGRRKKSTRFDPENASCLCFSCHRYFTENPGAHRDWFFQRLGEKRYDALMLRANMVFGCDEELIEIFLNSELKRMGESL